MSYKFLFFYKRASAVNLLDKINGITRIKYFTYTSQEEAYKLRFFY